MLAVIVALGSLGYIYYAQNHPVIPKVNNISSGDNISVKQPGAAKLSPNTISSNTAPSATSSPINTDNNLQSNVNYNDPAVQNMNIGNQ
jgi:hypothetical protein